MQKLGVEDTIFRRKTSISVRGKVLDFRIPKVMGIVNVTPDSFYSGSTVNSQNTLSERVKDMLLSGADILDVGGYSSRPGADDISLQEEIDRVCPAIEQILRDHPEAIISVDTFRSEVADRALQLGAGIINDIRGFQQDPDLPAVADALMPDLNVIFSGAKLETDQMNFLYNIADITVNIASNEGFGFIKNLGLHQNHP